MGTPSRIDFLDSARALAIVLVVGVHASGYVGASDMGPLWPACLFVVKALPVPVFFFCEGYIFQNSSAKPYGQILRQGARRLLLPWFLASVVYTLVRWGYEWATSPAQTFIVNHSPAQVLSGVYLSTFIPQLYFLPALFVLRMFSPALARVRNAGLGTAIAVFSVVLTGFLAIEAIMHGWTDEGAEPVLHGLWGLSFCLAGMICARELSRLQLLATAVALCTISAIVYHLMRDEPSSTNKSIQFALLIGFMLALRAWAHPPRWLTAVGRQTMEIFILHAPFLMSVMHRVVDRVLPAGFLQFWVLVVVVTATSLAVAFVLRKIPGTHLFFGTNPPRR